MKALCWHGKEDVRLDRVPDPQIVNPSDIVIQVTLSAICGSDLHLYNGYIPTMEEGDVLGHEFMGKVVEVGKNVKKLKVGDRVVVPFPIACGCCYFCKNSQTALCENSNPNAWLMEKAYGHSGAAIFGYSHMMGGYSGGQAEYVRVPFGDFGPIKVPEELSDEQVLFLTDIFPTGYMAAENCEIQEGDVVAVWGAGPVGQFAMESAFLLGASRVIGIDCVEDRLKLAEGIGVEPVNFKKQSVVSALEEATGGRGPDACIDAVGLEANAHGILGNYDKIKQGVRLQTDRPQALREAIYTCRKGGILSIPGVYGGVVDKLPLGAIFGKGLKLRAGQTHVHRYLKPLLDRIQKGEVDLSRIISHRIPLSGAPQAYRTFREKKDHCTKVVLNMAA